MSDAPDAPGPVPPVPPPTRRPRLAWRLLRGLTRLLVFIPLVLALVVGLVSWQLLESRRLGRWVLRDGIPRLNAILPGEIRVGRATGELGHHLVLEDVEIRDERGEPCIRARRVELWWEALDLLARRGEVSRVVVEDPWVLVHTRDDGTLNLVSAFVKPRKSPKPPGSGMDLQVRVGQVELRGGGVEVRRPGKERLAIAGIELQGSWSMDGPRQDAAIRLLRAALRAPRDLGELSLQGGVHLDGTDLSLDGVVASWREGTLSATGRVGPVGQPELDLAVALEGWDLGWLADLGVEAPLHGVVDLAASLDGTLDSLGGAATLRTASGGTATLRRFHLAPKATPITHGLDLDLVGLDLAEILTVGGLPGPIDASIVWEGQGRGAEDVAGTVDLRLRETRWEGMPFGPGRLRGKLQGRSYVVEELDSNMLGGHVAGRGSVDLVERRFQATLNARLPDLGAAGRRWRLPVAASGLVLSGEAAGSWNPPGAEGARPRLRLQTQGRLLSAELRRETTLLAGVELRWDLDGSVPDRGVPTFRGPVHLLLGGARHGGQQLDRLSLDAQLEGAGAHVALQAGRAEQPLGTPVERVLLDLGFDGRVEWADLPTLRVGGEELRLRAGGLTLQSRAPFSLKTRDGAVQVDALTLDAGPGTVQLGGRFHRGEEAKLTFRLLDLDLSRLAPLVPADTALGGQIDDLTVKLSSTLARPKVEARLDARRLTARGHGPLDLHAEARADGGKLTGQLVVTDLATLQVGAVPLGLRLDGQGPPAWFEPDGAWDLHLDLPRAVLGDRLRPLAITVPPGLDPAQSQARLEVGGTTRAPTVSLDLSLSGLTVAEQDVALKLGARLAEGRATLQEGAVRVGGATVLDLDGSAQVPLGALLLATFGPAADRGPPPRPVSDVELGAKLRKLPMGLVHALAPASRPLTGAWQGELLVRGQASQPLLDLDLRLLGGRLGGQALESAILDLALVDGLLRGTVDIVPAGGGRLRLTPRVSLPLALDGSRPIEEAFAQEDLRVEVEGNGFPLQLVTAFVPGTLESEGRIELHGQILGSLREPVPRVTLGMEKGRLCLAQTSVCWEDLGVDLRWEKGEIALAGLGFRTVPVVKDALDATRRPAFDDVAARRRFDLTGRVGLVRLRPHDIDLKAHLDDAWITFTPEVKAQGKGTLTARGQWPALTVDGDLELGTISVDLGREDIGRELQDLQLPANLTVHRTTTPAGPGEVRKAAAVRPAWLDASTLRLGLHLGSHVRVKLAVGVARQDRAAARVLNLLGSIEPDLLLQGDLTVRMARGKPTLEGAISTRPDSRLEILTRRFDLEPDSAITFAGEPLDTRLGLRGLFQSRYGPISAVVGGTVSAPSLEFRSEAFSEPADMISVLITGKPMDELSAAEGREAQGGLAKLLGGFASEIAGKVVPLDTVEVDLGDGTGGSAELGKQLASNVFLVTRFRWGADNEDNRVEAEVQVQITPTFYVEARIGDLLKGAAEAVFRVRF